MKKIFYYKIFRTSWQGITEISLPTSKQYFYSGFFKQPNTTLPGSGLSGTSVQVGYVFFVFFVKVIFASLSQLSQTFLLDVMIKYISFYYIEPVGSVGPRLLSGNDIKVIDVALSYTITLLCPAQAYPVPYFR